MNKKQIYILLAIFGFLAAGIFLKTLQKPRGLVSEDYGALDFSADRSKIAAITLTRNGQEALKVLKQDGVWRLPGLWDARASEGRVEEFLKMVTQARGELRSEDPALFADYGISDPEALGLVFTDEAGKTLLDLRAGTRPFAGGGTFVRRTGSNAVFLTDMNLWSALGLYGDIAKDPLKSQPWADLEPLKLDASALRSVEIWRAENGGGPPQASAHLKLSEKKEWGFASSYGRFQIDPQKAENFIRALVSLRAQNVLDPLGSYGFDRPALEIKIETEKETVVLTVGAETAGKTGRALKVGTDPSVYEISPYLFDEWSADDSRFFKAGLLTVAPEAVESILLRKQKEEKTLKPGDAEFAPPLETLGRLEPAGLLLTESQKKLVSAPGQDQITIALKDGQKFILDIGGRSGKDRYAASVRGEPASFSIREADYEGLFKIFKTTPSQTVQNQAE